MEVQNFLKSCSEKSPLAGNFIEMIFGRTGINMWTSNSPIENPGAGYDNSDIPKVGYKTYRIFHYKDSELKHLEYALGTGWDPVPSRLLKLWSKRG